MVKILLVASVVTGVASQYDPGVFESVVRVRQQYGSLPDQLPDYDGAHVAVLNCDDVGRRVLVCNKDGDGRFALVADCAGITDGGHAWMVRNGIAGELDPVTAARLDAVGEEIVIYGDVALAGTVPGRGMGEVCRR